MRIFFGISNIFRNFANYSCDMRNVQRETTKNHAAVQNQYLKLNI